MEKTQNRTTYKRWIVPVVVAAVFIVGSFFGGMKYQQSKTPAFGGRQANGGLGRGNRNGYQPVAGEVMSVADKSITVKMMDGSTKIVILSDSTSYSNSASANKNDVKSGMQIAVFGMANSDGSVTAQSVSLNPVRMFGRNAN